MQRNKKKNILLLLHLFTLLSFAQSNKQIRAYNLADGLPQSQVYDVLQDHYGYLWLGTQGGGIARFDGNEFKVWNEKKGLLSNYIHSLKFKNDSLFIGTKYGLSIKIKDRFVNYKSPQINKIIPFKKDLILATSKGCFQFNDSLKLVKLHLNNQIDFSLINDIKLINNSFYIATNNGLFKSSLDLSKIKKLSDFDFKAIETYNNIVFAAAYTHGVFAFNLRDQFQIIDVIKRINNIKLLNKNELWITTNNAGVKIINADNYEFIQNINKKNGLGIANILKVLKDKQQNIWLASSGGLFKIFDNNFFHYNKSNGLKGKSVYAIHSFNNALYLSNSEEGLIKIDSTGLQSVSLNNAFLNVKIKTLASTKNSLFAGTDGKGILVKHISKRDSISYHLDVDNFIVPDTIQIKHQFIDTLNTKKGMPFKWIKKIHINKNKIWAASYSSGIIQFEYNANEKTIKNKKIYALKQGLKDLYINDLTSDNKGAIWYATKNGHLGTIYNNKVRDLGNVLQKNTAIRTLIFHNEQLFIATSNQGVWWSDLSIPLKFSQLSGDKDLYSNNIYQLIFDAKNQLWAGSENGVDKITLDKNNNIKDVHHFGRNDGFLGIETCQNAVIKDRANNLWFGTINGLTKHQPSNTKLQLKKPNLFFENIEVMNESLDTIQLQKFIKNKQVLKLKPNQNLLAFYFKTVDINHPKELEYRWKLDNYKWSNWNKDTKVNIASDYGKHSLKAQSRDVNWTLSDVLDFKFERAMPLFKKPWFIWTAASILGLLLISLIYFYFLRLKKRNLQEKERLQLENNLLSLEQKALRLQMNPHFIFNVLNGIKAMSINDVKTMHKTINKFATLLRATLTNSRKDSITLAEEIITLKNYIEVEQLMTEKVFTYQINIETEMDSEEILIPPMLIQPFVENAIRHGIMAVKRDGKLNITFKTKNDFLHCTIIDNGIGINTSKENKTLRNSGSNHQSMALEVTKERIEYLAGKNTLIINEVIDKSNKLAGTKVSFKIPLITDY